MIRRPPSLDRRRFTAALAATAAAGLLRPARAVDALPLEEVAPGNLVYAAPHELASPQNLGMIGNVGGIVGEDAVAVIDTGGSFRGGSLLRAAIRQRTDRPIRYVIATHVHPDHLLGHAAFGADEPTFVGHAGLPRALAERGPFYLERAHAELGAAAAGTAIVAPTLLVEDRLELDLGGRVLELEAHRAAHTDNDLTVLDRRAGILWPGDLLFVGRCPTLDGSINGWLDVLDALARRQVAGAVPGHGPARVAWPEAAATPRTYLGAVRDQVRNVIGRGGTIEDALREVTTAFRADLALYDETHPRNVTAAFAELEWE